MKSSIHISTLSRALASSVTGLIALAVMAQPNPLQVNAPGFVNIGANQILLAGDSGALDHWHSALDRLVFEGSGQVNVVHIGGSHIQADTWTQQGRQRLQQLVPGIRAARGLVFPFTTAKTNNPWWYQVEQTGTWTALRSVTRADTSTLGLSGISVTTRDTLTQMKVQFRTEQFAHYPFNRVRVLHRMDSSYVVEAWSPDSTVQISSRVDGTGGYTEFIYDRDMDTLRLRFRRTDPGQRQFTLYGILLESDLPSLVHHAVGVNGASTASYLRCQRFVPDLALLKPDLVIFSVGINDAHDSEFSPTRFKRNYTDLIARVRLAAPNASILLTTNSDSYFKRKVANRNAFKVRDVMLELAAEQGVAVWDLFTVMGGLGSIATWEKNNLAQKDRIHFNRGGYILLGDLQVAAMMDAYGKYLERTSRP